MQRPTQIQIDILQDWLQDSLTPIKFPAPGVVIPSDMQIQSATADPIVKIRSLFNDVNDNNWQTISTKMREAVQDAINLHKTVEKSAQEIFNNFKVCNDMIANYIILLNACKNMRYANSTEMPLSEYFVKNCIAYLRDVLNEASIAEMCEYDQDDIDELDKYNKTQSMTCTLIATVCQLYNEPNKNNTQVDRCLIYPIVNDLMTRYILARGLMNDIGDVYSQDFAGTDQDYDDYELHNKKCVLLASYIIKFMSQSYHVFIQDTTPIPRFGKVYTMPTLAEKFKQQVVPLITESYMVVRITNILQAPVAPRTYSTNKPQPATKKWQPNSGKTRTYGTKR